MGRSIAGAFAPASAELSCSGQAAGNLSDVEFAIRDRGGKAPAIDCDVIDVIAASLSTTHTAEG